MTDLPVHKEVWVYAPGWEFNPFDVPEAVHNAEGTLDPEVWAQLGAQLYPEAIYFIYTKEEQIRDREQRERGHKITYYMTRLTKSYPCYCDIFAVDHSESDLSLRLRRLSDVK